MQLTLHTATVLCKYASVTVLFGNNGHSHTVCTQSDMFICTHILHNVETLIGQNKQTYGTARNDGCQGNLSRAILGTRAIDSAAQV